MDIVIVIPAYNPDSKFITFLDKLVDSGYHHIIVVNDGSKDDSLFQEAQDMYGCIILTHSINLGQGRAYKTAFNYYLSSFRNSMGIIQCDCDGQHDIEDINKCAILLRSNPDKFILGVRDFSCKSVPFRNRFGNKCTSFIFSFFCGIDLKDTQTGLKGIPQSLIPFLLETSGERFEYASSVLLEVKRCGVEFLQFPIKTIYINGNKTSHFNPWLDSLRIYSLIFKYLLSSLSSFVVDFIVFFVSLFFTNNIIISTYVAKILSCSYTFIINKKLVFSSRVRVKNAVIKFVSLCLIQSTLSAFMTNILVHGMAWNVAVAKITVEIVLFFVSFQIQNRLIF